ncbi:TPA: hypothetical protein ACIDIN_003953 [Shigella flexneri]
MFQQRNVLASWLATGCGVALYLALTARTRSLTLICLLSLYPLSTALVLTQSRVGLLGLFCVIVLAALADRPRWRGRPLSGLLRLIFVASLLCQTMPCQGRQRLTLRIHHRMTSVYVF